MKTLSFKITFLILITELAIFGFLFWQGIKRIDLSEFDKTLERKININFYPSFKDIHKHLRENIFNGIVLVGGIEL